MKHLNKLIIIVCLLLSCSGPFYAINTDTDQEPGFQRYCWNADGFADNSAPPRCSNPQEIIWPQERIPLRVYVSSRDARLTSAMQTFNRSFNCTLLQYTPNFAGSDVRVYLNVPMEARQHWRGGTTHRRLAGGRIVATISTGMIAYDSTLNQVLLHECGHLFSLSHDREQFSIMYPYANSSLDGRFTMHDRRLINERYCR